MVKEFRYLGRILTSTDDDWPAVARNLQRVWATWGRLARILGREGADPKVSHNFYIAVTQQVLLFGAETWVLTVRMEAALDAFQGRVARRLTGRVPRLGRDGKWQYLPLAGATKDAGIVRTRTSVLRRQNTVAQFVATRPILDICEGTERRGGDTGPPKVVGTDRNQLEAGAGEEGKSGGGGRKDHNKNCRDDNGDTGDGVIRFGKGLRGGGVTGGQWLQWGGMERGGRLRHTLFFRRQEIHGRV